jgi:hypothetical protein
MPRSSPHELLHSALVDFAATLEKLASTTAVLKPANIAIGEFEQRIVAARNATQVFVVAVVPASSNPALQPALTRTADTHARLQRVRISETSSQDDGMEQKVVEITAPLSSSSSSRQSAVLLSGGGDQQPISIESSPQQSNDAQLSVQQPPTATPTLYPPGPHTCL